MKRYKSKNYDLPKCVINNFNVKINRKISCDQPINYGIKRCNEVRKLTAGLGEDDTTECLLDYDHNYIRNHYRPITVDLSREKELDADLKAIQQIQFGGQLKN